jgi:hypothetical protein
VRLRDQLQAASAPTRATEDGWTWLSTGDAASLAEMPPDWRLLVDQARFDEIGVVVVKKDGSAIRLFRTADRLQDNWAPGGVLRFDIAPAGSEVRELYLGFKGADDLSLMRKVNAVSRDRAAVLDARWLVLMGVFTGLLVSAFVYNLLVYAGSATPSSAGTSAGSRSCSRTA